MTLDELANIWKSADAQPLFAIDEDALRSALQDRSRKLRRALFSDEVQNYWTGLWIVGFLALWFWAGYPQGGALSQAYYIGLAVAVAAVVYFVCFSFFFVAQRTLQVPTVVFACSLRDQLDREIDYVAYQIKARTHWKRVLLHLGPPWFASVVAVWAADVRNDGLFRWTDLFSLAVVTAGWIHMHVLERRWAHRELVPRRQELRLLRQKLVAPVAEPE